MGPREVTARAVDWLNVKAVDWRLPAGRRDPEASAPAGGLTAAAPRRIAERRGVELWGVDGADWVAARIPATTAPGEAPALVLLHGWLAGPVQFAFYRWLVAPLRGEVDLWFPRLPEHGERATPGALSGELCLCASPERAAAHVRQAAAELAWLGRWLRSGSAPVTFWGVSLGGWVTALGAAPDTCDGVVLWAPVLDPDAALRDSRLGAVIARRSPDSQGGVGSGPDGSDLLPLERDWRLGAEKALLIGGSFDDIAPPSSLRLAAEQWSARLRVLDHGHITLLGSPTARRESLGFVRETCCSHS